MGTAPLTTGADQKPDGVEDASATNLFWSLFLFRNKFFDDLPLFVRQVCAIMDGYFHVTFSAAEDLRSSKAVT